MLFRIVVMYIAVIVSALISCRFLISFSASKNQPQYYAVYTAVSLVLNYVFLNTQISLPLIVNQIINILIAFAFTRLILKTSRSIALLTSMLNGVIFGIYNIVGFALSGILYRETQMSGYWIIIFNSAAILILSAVTFEVLIIRYGKYKTWNSKYSILYICPITFIYVVSQILINIAYNPVTVVDNRLQYSTNTAQDIEILFAIGMSLVSIYVILYFYEKVMAQIETENKMLALEAYAEMQKQYINEAKQKYEHTKAFRHDIRNHMVTLAGLAEKNETEKVKEYINRFENEVKQLSFEVLTGNAVIDVLFKEKLGFAREHGMKVVCEASIPKDFRIDDFDLCIIFFNALDNAIKGCEYADDKFIDVVAKKKKEFFIIDIMNSFHPVKYTKGWGLGLESIRFITEKYGGCLEISTDKEIFRVSIMFSLK